MPNSWQTEGVSRVTADELIKGKILIKCNSVIVHVQIYYACIVPLPGKKIQNQIQKHEVCFHVKYNNCGSL